MIILMIISGYPVVLCQSPSRIFHQDDWPKKLVGHGGAGFISAPSNFELQRSGGRDGRHPAGHRIRAVPSGTAIRRGQMAVATGATAVGPP